MSIGRGGRMRAVHPVFHDHCRDIRSPAERARAHLARLPRGRGGETVRMAEAVDPLLEGRNETPLQRCDRNLVELLQEVRVVQTGVQVLFAFLLTAPLSARFTELTGAQRIEYFVALLSTGAAAILLIAPTAHHRILFRCGDKDHLVRVANRYTLLGLVFVATAMVCALLFVSTMLFPGAVAAITVTVAVVGVLWCWALEPLLRRRQITGDGEDPTASPAALQERPRRRRNRPVENQRVAAANRHLRASSDTR
jgi:hypothetical protein